MGTLVYSIKGPHLFPRGDDYKIVNFHLQNLKSSSSEQFQPNLAKSFLG